MLLFIALILANCEQNISIKKYELTGINPIAYTDVIYGSNQDTVLASTFNGKIYQIINSNLDRKEIASVNDEIYNMAFNAKRNEIYAATLKSGILVINIKNGNVIRNLPIKETWAHKIYYNESNGILCTFDFRGNHYIWNSLNDYEQLNTPAYLSRMIPRHLSDKGDIYFDGREEVVIWNYLTNKEVKRKKVKGKLVDVDHEENFLMMGGKEFAFYSSQHDSIYYKKKHPDWPIHIPEKDTIVNIPISRDLITGLLTENNIYTIGLDRSLRKWDKQSGNLIETYLKHKGSISAMDITKDRSQLVTVDLEGEIEFWDL